MQPSHLHAFRAADIASSGPMRFVASTEGVGRDGVIIEAAGWQLGNYRKNPVVLWSHRYDEPPIGRAEVHVDGKRLLADITFDQDDERARAIERKFRNNYLNAISVGWETLEVDGKAVDGGLMMIPRGDRAARITKAELLDISAVPVPGDPDALKARAVRGLIDLGVTPETLANYYAIEEASTRGAIPANTGGPKQPENATWDGAAQRDAAPAERGVLRRMHAWVDPDGDPETKASYRFAHHTADGELNFRACVAALSEVERSDISDEDKAGVRRHLEAHYREFDREPPERSGPEAEAVWLGTALLMARFYLDTADDADEDEQRVRYHRLSRSYRRIGREPPEFMPRADIGTWTDEQFRGFFLEGETSLFPELFAARAGAVLSRRNKGDLEQAATLILGVVERAGREDAEPDEDERALRVFRTLLSTSA